MFAFILLAAMSVGSAVMVDQSHKGNLPEAPAACEVKYVKNANDNNLSRVVIDDKKGCEVATTDPIAYSGS